MAKFLTTSGVSYRIEDIIRNAKKSVVLVSPYLQFSKNFYERLKDAESHKVDITIIFGKNELNQKETDLLSELNKLKLYFSENLHAKCYFNESEMVITSMNMYEYSEKNNREMGVFITKSQDSDLFEEAHKETLSIINSAVPVPLNNNNNNNRITRNKKSNYSNDKKSREQNRVSYNNGFCIRCSDSITVDPERPYCNSCFQTWAQFENPHYEENACHVCGYENNSTIIKPVCYSCYKGIM